MRSIPVVLCISLSACLTMAADSPTTEASSSNQVSWTDTLANLPVVRWVAPWFAPAYPGETAKGAKPAQTCKAAPLLPITDPEALSFENSVMPSTDGLVPAMAQALAKFQRLVAGVGGKFVLKSAYRPPAYQAHLQQVWFKWMELRANRDPGCQELREEVAAEFKGHHLIETQKPVTSSDHTRGLAFDATVYMPVAGRHPVSVDRLAARAGIMRPDIVRDPVHYKLVALRTKLAAFQKLPDIPPARQQARSFRSLRPRPAPRLAVPRTARTPATE